MELKDYQRTALDAFMRWRDVLEEKARKAQEMRASLEKDGIAPPSELLDYPRAAWKRLAATGGVAASAGGYVGRSDAAGRPIPHICLKVPTGGGKTLLAAAALERLNRASGLVLWIVPTRAIYSQTEAALRDRQHPCRQMLERASGGRVKLLEKDDLFTSADIDHYLCVMLLTLSAANWRKSRDFLRMFRDSGRYPDLFPDSDDLAGDRRLLQRHPDLERVSESGPVKHSLFNAFKMLRPVVVLDEAHKAYGHKRGEEFAHAVSRLDPCLTIELSATPNRGISNLLVDIGGVELKAEEMIKLPVEVVSFTRTEWQHTLAQAHDELERLDGEAQALQADEGRYIRPIAVVRVERTGKNQRDGERVHAEDVRDHLIQNLGVPSRAIAVKSAERDELAGVDLLSPFSPIRWVITRDALKEGWDCPFAYLLVMLDNTTARRAVTQLVGRVMRQPHARRTGRAALDRCYVYCWNTDVGAAVEYVKQGLENEGLTGLGDDVFSASQGAQKVAVHRRQGWRRRDIFLPLVLHRDGAGWCELDYSRHILPHVDWDAIDAPDPERSLAQAAAMQTASVDLGDAPVTVHESQDVEIDKAVRLSWFARRLADILPNPWHASRIVEQLIEELRQGGNGKSDDHIHDRRSWLAHALRHHVADAMDCQAKRVFADKLHRKEIRFDLQTGQPNFRMAKCYEIVVPKEPRHFLHGNGKPMQLSLFEPIYEHHFDSDLECRFARYLDERKALLWWHRVASRQGGGYYLKGWRRDRIWPDFVAMGAGPASRPSFFVFETKGRHLDNPDTDYKRRVLEALEGAFNCGTMTVVDGPAKGSFHLLFDEEEFPKALAALGDGA